MAAGMCQRRWGAPRWPPIPPRARKRPGGAGALLDNRRAPAVGARRRCRRSNGGALVSMAEWRFAMASPRRFRGLGKGRKTRRTLERGGIGAAAQLNRALGAWDGVRITP